MIIYQANKSEFIKHTFDDDIEQIILRQFRTLTGHSVSPSEIQSWKQSLLEMGKVMRDTEIPDEARIGIEYQLPQSSKRIDFIIAGADSSEQSKVVIVELKQWSTSRRSEKDAIIWARRGGPNAETEGPHPSYQAWSYAAYLEDFNTSVRDHSISLKPCAYLHNHPRDGEIDHQHYDEHIGRAPLFLLKERNKLQKFIREHIRYGDRKNLLYTIERGRIKPSKQLADAVTGMLQGRVEFTLIDDQKVVFETALKADERADSCKQVVIVSGGPGTGKSVVAINLLAVLLARGRNVRYVSKNSAPRAVYEAKLTGSFKKSRISNLFGGSGAFINTQENSFDTLIIDEAHRLNEKGGLYQNLGENQIKELVSAARCSVFFVDDNQRVTLRDIGHTEELRRYAELFNAEINEVGLTSQFRCNGSDGYLAWLDNSLEITRTPNQELDTNEFDFRVIDDPNELHRLIELKNHSNGRSRVVAGYCWPWPSKRNSEAWDIEIPEHNYRRRWNLTKDGSLWIITKRSVEQVGCIHTCQGLELDYVGVIIGNDLTYEDGRILTDATKRATSDQTVRGIKKMLREDKASALAIADRIVKNTYRTLMTRGMKGCYVYCVDSRLAEYLRSRVSSSSHISKTMMPAGIESHSPSSRGNVIPLPLVSRADRDAGMPAVPVVNLKFAAGLLSESQALSDGATEWVSLPDWIQTQPGLFVAQVLGESMNRKIPNGSWCLFRANPAGTRQGKIVVVQHHSISDPDTGGRFTVKRYSSIKRNDEETGWQHQEITLTPDSDQEHFEPIKLTLADDDDGFRVVAELLTVL